LNFATIFNYINSSADKAPLPGFAYNTWAKLILKAESDIFNADCQCFLNTHGLDAESLLLALESQVPYDATRSKITLFNAGLYRNSLAPSDVENDKHYQSSVAQVFQQHIDYDALAQAHGNVRTDVYYRPIDIDEITIEHESLHNLTGKDDYDLARQLGGSNASGTSASKYISQALLDNRCDKPTSKRKKR
jgi:hypothetical protein